VASRFGLKFTLPEELKRLYLSSPNDLAKWNGDASWTLPVPARFIVDRGGVSRSEEAQPPLPMMCERRLASGPS